MTESPSQPIEFPNASARAGFMTDTIPSWLRWPPNCCETCVGWDRKDEHTGVCQKDNALDVATITDSRYRCPSFQRKPDDDRTN